MSTHYVMYQVTYPREVTSVNHYSVFTQTEGKIFFNPSSDKCCGHLTVVHNIKQVLYGYYLNNGDHKANTFVMCSIWVNTVNIDVIMFYEEILVFKFQIRNLYTAVLLYSSNLQNHKIYTAVLLHSSNLQNHKIYTQVSAAPSAVPCFIQVCSIQTIHTMQSG
jgi:hypothetical protein